ncbi:hypothetical protein VB264_22685 [Arcicella aquatica]|uniref:TIR domain-containing protein n=1 Tax=Arcicella aquatica TaxID=217141 RepID=A0ABU5QU40_9BACT|nr:hypothetical protein [Arcicella aquatica]MEA5260622.1 hypothetical protein [Arcicella aquatica]
MYQGFNLKLSERVQTTLLAKHVHQILFDEHYLVELYDNPYLETGKTLFDNDKTQIQTSLDKYLLPNNSLNGSEIQNNWFPTIQADIFLSHSHQNEELAYRLAGWLFNKFGLKTFVDSAIWGYSDKLLRIIDNVYSWDDPIKKNFYSYKKRNLSTSHVYLMLLTAINKMIDNCECIIFLNTPDSISSEDTIKMTSSPWIYSEIALCNTIEKKKKERTYPIRESLSKSVSPLFLYNVDTELSQFTNLDINVLKKLSTKQYDNPLMALDELYKLPLKNTK